MIQIAKLSQELQLLREKALIVVGHIDWIRGSTRFRNHDAAISKLPHARSRALLSVLESQERPGALGVQVKFTDAEFPPNYCQRDHTQSGL